MAVRCAEAPTRSWPGFFAKDDTDESIRRSGCNDVPLAGKGSDCLIEIRLAMQRLRATLSTTPKNDPTKAPPLRCLSRPIGGARIADPTDRRSSHALPDSCLSLITTVSRIDWGRQSPGAIEARIDMMEKEGLDGEAAGYAAS